jgi:hypothetical protein
MSQRVPAEPATTGQFCTVIGVVTALGLLGLFSLPDPLKWISVIGACGGVIISAFMQTVVDRRFEEWKAG